MNKTRNDNGYYSEQEMLNIAQNNQEEFIRLVEENNPAALYAMGMFFINGEKSNEAISLIEKSAELNYAPAQYFLGSMYLFGDKVQQNYQKAKKLIEQAANQNHAEAQFWLGMIYYGGKGVRQDYLQAKEWFENAAMQDHNDAQSMLGSMYCLERDGLQQDYQKAKYWYEKAAEKDNPVALNNLGWLYEDGLGVKKDLSKAKGFYGKACDHGYQDGCDKYRELNERGIK